MSIAASPKDQQMPEAVGAVDEPLATLDTDLDSNLHFGKQTLQVWPDAVKLLNADGEAVREFPVHEVRNARNEPLVSGGRLELELKSGEIIALVHYSQSLAAAFSEVARGIEQLAKGESFEISIPKSKTRCPKCGRLLPEKDGICPACVKRTKTLLRILAFMRPYSKQAIALALLSLLTTLLNLLPPWIQGNLIDGVLRPHKDLPMLWKLMAVWFGVLAINSGMQILTGRLISFLGGRIAGDLRSRVYRAVEFLQLSFFDKKQVGAITSRVTSDTDRIWGFLVEGVPYFLLNGLTLIGVIVFLLLTNWVLTVAILGPVPFVVGIGLVFWKPMSQMYHRVSQKWARFYMHLNESLSGIRVVKAFAKEDLEFDKFTSRNVELQDAGIRADTRWYTVFGVISFFTASGTLICWVVGGYMVYNRTLTLGEFWRITAYISLVYGPLQWFSSVNQWFSRAMAGAERIFEITDMDPEAKGRPGVSKQIVGEITFDNVRFGYDKSNPVLKGIHFTAHSGEMIGLVGKSGAGKSTTINLICRFYEPDVGTIIIDGVDYREISLDSLRNQIGIVLQEPFLFNGTIAENIAYGKPGAQFEEIMAASQAANAHNFILSKPDGYDTLVGERGSKLSGGERQRVSIARAILHDPRILILDEATSSVDVETERQIQEAISRLTAGRTTFAIAHRLSTLRNASRLIVLEKGQIAEIGTHEELMSKEGTFYNLVQSQTAINEIIGVGTNG